ncbi:ABC-2 type transport system permease protein [Hathewaya proteolytica DSM 3090]|uniref:ABC-2 type transport system permease protein n=1 Tax=Hathewaya proteolytica DSM 3090 TaxID=1121331 RepID=A0A1M6P3Y7_9CLOT|nr:hypothetical protein [Hathewaya proteolytica]SHK02620.1 ABC-2 type transport system permease protein [Hathewaya proteolytica DSM 3090]
MKKFSWNSLSIKNLKLILKINLINTLGLNKLGKKHRKSNLKDIFVGGGVLFSLIIIGILVSLYFSLMAKGLKSVGMLDLLLYMSVLVVMLLTFFTSMFKAQGILFSAKDFELLMTMPVQPSTILSSKIIELLVINYLFSAMVIFPSSIIYFTYKQGVNPVFFLFIIALFFFVPLLPIVISSLFAFLLSYISSKVKAKNIVLMILSMASLILILVGSSKMNTLISYVMKNSTSITNAINKLCPPAFLYVDAVTNYNIISLIKMILWSLIPFILFVAVFSKGYMDINLKLGEIYKKGNYKIKRLKQSSVFKALLKKEIKRYISSPIYVMNTSVGVVMSTVAAVSSLFVGSQGIIKILASGNDMTAVMPLMLQFIQLIPIAVLVFSASLSCTTGSSISIEGKNLWILKTLPVEAKQVFLVKIFVNLIITVPAIILDSILFAIGFKLNPLNFFFVLSIPLLLSLFSAISGLIINLTFPNFSWKSETYVVKQSISSMLSMFLGIIVMIAIGFIIYLTYKFTSIRNLYVYLTAVIVVLTILIFIAIMKLRKKGEQMFREL